MADLYLERIGLARPTIVERDNNGKIERLESVGLDIASLVVFWRKCFDLNGLLFEKITLHCKTKDFNAMGGRTLAACHNVRELLAEQGVECVIDDEWFKNRKVKNEEVEQFARDISKTRMEIISEASPICKTLLEYIEKEKHSAVKEFAEKLQKELKQSVLSSGYCAVNLCKGGEVKLCSVHRLVATAFLSNPNKCKEVNHINENTKDNRVENLEWCDRLYNANYGTLKIRLRDIRTKNHCKAIYQYAIDRTFIAKYQSGREITRKLGFNNSYICRCCKKGTGIAYGYLWSYNKIGDMNRKGDEQ